MSRYLEYTCYAVRRYHYHRLRHHYHHHHRSRIFPIVTLRYILQPCSQANTKALHVERRQDYVILVIPHRTFMVDIRRVG